MKLIIKQIIDTIERNQKIAIFHHQNIDGDSFSSSYGLLLALKKKYPKKEIFWIADKNEVDNNFPFLKYNKSYTKDHIDDSYLAIIGDTSSESKVSFYNELVKANEIICFDHHQNNINIKHNIFWHEPTYPASALQAIEIVKELQIELNEDIAFALMVGILTDTGNFVYSLNDTKSPKYFAYLLRFISKEKMNYFWNNMRRRTLEDINVTKELFNNLQFDGGVAYVVIDKSLMNKFNGVNFKLKINTIANIDKFPIWAFFVIDDDHVNLHFRSNGPNVSEVAIHYNGGGHIRAAGAKVKRDETIISQVLKKLNMQIK